jgi:dienelactone hydrolase
MKWIVTLIMTMFFLKASSQQEITFIAIDSVRIYADRYHANDTFPYVVLFHQQDASRGEYLETAPKIIKMGYNILAVDLRYGDEINYKSNATVSFARENGYQARMRDIEKDMLGAINYLNGLGVKKMVLVGSSFSATMALKVGKQQPQVTGVIAFSPGEYFTPHFSVENVTGEYKKPVLIACTKQERPYVDSLVKNIPGDYLTIFSPEDGDGISGSSALWETTPTYQEYWLALLIYFRNLRDL